MDRKAVVFGVNQYVGLSVARCLGEHGIAVVAVVIEDHQYEEDYGFYSKFVSEKVYVPHYDNRAKRHRIVARLVEYARKQQTKPVLIPTADPHVEVIDEFMDELREHFLLPPIARGLYTRLLDKDQLYLECLKHGVLVPPVLVPSDQDFWGRVEGEIGYPCIIKPVNSFEFSGIFKTKMFIANNRDELTAGLAKAEAARQKVFIQKLVQGFDDHVYTYDAYVDSNGRVTHWVTCQKQRQYPINFGSSTYLKQKYVQEIADIGQRFLTAVGYRGFAEIEFKKDVEDGRFYLIEINVRITNFNALLHKLGFNVPLLTCKDLWGQPLDTLALKKDTGWHFCYAYEDALAILGYLRARQLSLWQVCKSLAARKVYAIWDWRDIRPALRALGIYLRRLVNKYSGPMKKGAGAEGGVADGKREIDR